MGREKGYLITYYHNLFGESIDMRTFENRLLFQKRVYFIQDFGVPFGYNFGWYIRGPYSSELAGDGFELESLSKIVNRDWSRKSTLVPSPNEEDGNAIENVQEFFSNVQATNIDEARFLELLSSLHYMKTNWFHNSSYSLASGRLQEIKPKFSSGEIERAQELLQSLL